MKKIAVFLLFICLFSSALSAQNFKIFQGVKNSFKFSGGTKYMCTKGSRITMAHIEGKGTGKLNMVIYESDTSTFKVDRIATHFLGQHKQGIPVIDMLIVHEHVVCFYIPFIDGKYHAAAIVIDKTGKLVAKRDFGLMYNTSIFLNASPSGDMILWSERSEWPYSGSQKRDSTLSYMRYKVFNSLNLKEIASHEMTIDVAMAQQEILFDDRGIAYHCFYNNGGTKTFFNPGKDAEYTLNVINVEERETLEGIMLDELNERKPVNVRMFMNNDMLVFTGVSKKDDQYSLFSIRYNSDAELESDDEYVFSQADVEALNIKFRNTIYDSASVVTSVEDLQLSYTHNYNAHTSFFVYQAGAYQGYEHYSTTILIMRLDSTGFRKCAMVPKKVKWGSGGAAFSVSGDKLHLLYLEIDSSLRVKRKWENPDNFFDVNFQNYTRVALSTFNMRNGRLESKQYSTFPALLKRHVPSWGTLCVLSDGTLAVRAVYNWKYCFLRIHI